MLIFYGAYLIFITEIMSRNYDNYILGLLWGTSASAFDSHSKDKIGNISEVGTALLKF